MYNVNKGGNTLDESEILEPMHACLRELIERDIQGKGHLIRYTDNDVIAVTLLYANILGNRLVHKFTDENVSILMSQQIADNYGLLIESITLGMTQVNVNEHFNSGDKE